MRLAIVCVILCVASICVAHAEDRKDIAIRRLEALSPTNVVAAWHDMVRRWPQRFEAQPEWLTTLAQRREHWLKAMKGDWGAEFGGPQPVEAAEQLLSEVRTHLLSNPLLDCNKILAVRRRQKNLGLHNNWQQPRDIFNGCENELGILENVRTSPKFTTLDVTAKDGYIGELCLSFDAQKVMYTRRTERKNAPPKIGNSRTSERIDRVFELNLKMPEARPQEMELIPDADVNCYAGCYLPDGAVLFLSDASMVGVPCVVGTSWVASIYRKEVSGKIRRLTFDQDNNWCPNVMADGRVMFLHWEYADITHYASRILFTMNPDGTVQRAYYGSNSYWPNALFNARQCPDDPDKFTAIVTGHHGQPRYGELVLFDVNKGRHTTDGVVQRFTERGKKVQPIIRDRLADYSWPKFCHPWPLSSGYVIVAARPTEKDAWGLYLADEFDNLTPIIEDATNVYLEPIPLQEQKRPPALASKIHPELTTGLMKVTDVYDGPGLKGVPRGTIKALRLYTYSFAYRWMGGETDHHGLDGPWDIKRILGTVPVKADGSAYFEVPANLPISIQPLDEKGRAVQLMRSWTQVMPGELASCSGCHEETSSSAGPNRRLMAMERAPSKITPFYGPERGYDFRREVQPVLDKHCVSCHNAQHKTLNLTDRPDICIKTKEVFYMKDGLFSPSYIALCSFVRSHTQEGDSEMLNPGEVAADTTQLVQILERGHHGVKLDDESWARLNTWIDLNRMGHGTWSETVGTNRVAHFARRRAELQKQYANVVENHEQIYKTQHDAVPQFSAVNAPRTITPAAALAKAQPFAPQTLTLEGIEFVRVPGSVDGAIKPFWVSKFEVTNAQYHRFVPQHNSGLERGDFMQFTEQERGYALNKPQQPAVRISRDEAAAFCSKLAALTKRNVMLPSAEEWRWAARAGSTNELWWGCVADDFSKNANLADKTFRRQDRFRAQIPGMAVPPWRAADERFDDGYRVTAPVGSFAPNAWGLYDVIGNVWEWTRDNEGACAVALGGSFWARPKDATFNMSITYRPWHKVHDVGFRIIIKD